MRISFIGIFFCLASALVAREEESATRYCYVKTTHDKSSIEEDIYYYFKHTYGIVGEKKYIGTKNKDLYLVFKSKEKLFPRTDFIIDTNSTWDANGKFIAQTIQISSRYKLPQKLNSSELRFSLLKFNASYMYNIKSPITIAIKDQYLLARTTIEMPEPLFSVPLEMVYQRFRRFIINWVVYHKMLQSEFKIFTESSSVENNKNYKDTL